MNKTKTKSSIPEIYFISGALPKIGLQSSIKTKIWQ